MKTSTLLQTSLSLVALVALLIDPTSAHAQCAGGAPNGALDAGEECDDANMTLADGCNAMCAVEAGWICSQPVDFDNLTALEYAGGNSSWTFSADGWTGTQTVNTTRPTFAVFGADATATTYTFDMGVTTSSDDDFIGFVFGFELSDLTDASAEYILLDWKRATQGCGAVGMALSRVSGIPTVVPTTTSNFWCHTGNATNGVNELARAAFYGGLGWIVGLTYRFEIEYSVTRIIVRVTDPLTTLTTTVFDVMGTFPPGQIGFYGLSQENARYTIVGPRGPSLCNRPPVVPNVTATVPHQTGGRCFDVTVGASDPDGDGIDPSSVSILSSSAGVTATDPSTGAGPGEVCLVPTDPTTTNTFVIQAEVCDDRPVPQGCTPMMLTVTFETPCEGRTAGASCTDVDGDAGTCRGAALTCCTGCWNGTTCVGGTALAACGATGALCASCADGNACTTDACASGTCSNTPLAATTPCPGGVCSGATAMCVACLSNTQCGGATPLCDTSTNTCVGCLSDASCSGATPFCDLTDQECVECLTGASCADANECTADVCTAGVCSNPAATSGTTCATGVCDGASACVTCVADSSCSGTTPFCVGNDCVGCRDAADCDDSNECTTDACGTGMCSTTLVAAGTACSTGVCTPAGMCAGVAVTIDDPADGSSTAEPMPVISGTATPGTVVTVTIGGEVVGTATAADDGTWSVTVTTPLSDGDVTVTASISTSNGDAMTSATFTVDTETAVAITSPADGATTLDSTPNITGTGEPGATVVVTVDGVEVGTATVGEDGVWMVPITDALSNGTHTAEATATDSAGNTATDTATFTVDSSSTVTIVTPANGSRTNDPMPTVSGTAEPGATIVVTVVVAGETREVGTTTADDEGNWSIEITDTLPEGTHTVTATSTDTGGSMASDSTTFTVDTSTTVMITGVDPTTGIISGTGEPGATVVVTINGVEVGTAMVDEDGLWFVDAEPLGSGTYEVSATATDPDGNTATDTTTITVGMRPDAGPAPDDLAAGRYSGGALCAAGGPLRGNPFTLLVLMLTGLALWRRRK
jgi:cysteine-rich repeat protein